MQILSHEIEKKASTKRGSYKMTKISRNDRIRNTVTFFQYSYTHKDSTDYF